MNELPSNLAITTVDTTVQAHGYSDDNMVNEWLNSKRSSHTRIAYKHDVDTFLSYVQVPLNQVTRSMVQAYEQTLTGLETSTISRKLAAVKSLLTYAHKTGYLLVNVGSMITLPSVRTRLAERILTREEVDSMIGSETDPYNHALLRLLYSTGIRVSEACDLTWRDVVARDNGKAQVTVFGKGGKERAILISADTYKELQNIRVDEQVFTNLYPRKAERIILNAAKRAGINGAVSPHWLRHANASHALDRQAPIHVVQATLGHASLATTSKYVHARPSDSTGEYLGY